MSLKNFPDCISGRNVAERYKEALEKQAIKNQKDLDEVKQKIPTLDDLKNEPMTAPESFAGIFDSSKNTLLCAGQQLNEKYIVTSKNCVEKYESSQLTIKINGQIRHVKNKDYGNYKDNAAFDIVALRVKISYFIENRLY